MQTLHDRLDDDLEQLCVTIGARPVGGEANRRAVAWAASELEGAGWRVEHQEFACLDWRSSGATLEIGGRTWSLEPGPFSPPFDAPVELIAASSLADLASRPPGGAAGRALLLHGEVASEQLFPKNFPFFRMDEHVAVYDAIERLGPAVVVTASPPNPELAAGSYPLPMIEDGDFTIPSAYTTAEAGAEIVAGLAGHRASPPGARLRIESERRDATAANVIARSPQDASVEPRVLLAAHIDTKPGTPGALDNAAGVATLLAAARTIAASGSRLPVEIALFNGEDYYSAPGQVAYMESGTLEPGRVALGVNVDGAGLQGYRAAWSTYEVEDAAGARLADLFAGYSRLFPGEQWYQGDHAIFVQSGIPALAVTCAPEGMDDLLGLAHTTADTIDRVDVTTLGELADALARVATDPRLRSTPSPG